jgi:GntR family transcriptional repressor for pyruvate dehydrogenase complex
MAGLTRSTPERLFRYLEGGIVSGGFPPGTRLPSERELAARFGASRPVVREVVSALVERGLVEVVAGRGTFVREPHPMDVARPLTHLFRRQRATPRQLVSARRVLESEAAVEAVEHADGADLDRMASAVTALEAARSPLERAVWDIRFHLALARASHNPVIVTMLSSIAPLSLELMLRSMDDRRVSAASLPFHRRVLEAIQTRDPEAAHAAMVAHMDSGARLYGLDYDRSLDEVVRPRLRRLLGPAVDLDSWLTSVLQQVFIEGEDEGEPAPMAGAGPGSVSVTKIPSRGDGHKRQEEGRNRTWKMDSGRGGSSSRR